MGVNMGKKYYIGPRKVVASHGNVFVYLGKPFYTLRGKRVMLIVEVLDEVENENKENKT